MAGRLLVKVDYYMDRDLLSRVRPYTTMYSNTGSSVGPLTCYSLWDRSLPSVRSPFAASIIPNLVLVHVCRIDVAERDATMHTPSTTHELAHESQLQERDAQNYLQSKSPLMIHAEVPCLLAYRYSD